MNEKMNIKLESNQNYSLMRQRNYAIKRTKIHLHSLHEKKKVITANHWKARRNLFLLHKNMIQKRPTVRTIIQFFFTPLQPSCYVIFTAMPLQLNELFFIA